MSRADETTAQSTETADNEQSTDYTTPLPRRFLATVAVVRSPGSLIMVTDDRRVRADISIEYSIETLEEFATFWEFRDYRSWKRAALEARLSSRQEPDAVTYAVDEDNLEEWDITVDGRVEAFAGLVEDDGRLHRTKSFLSRCHSSADCSSDQRSHRWSPDD